MPAMDNDAKAAHRAEAAQRLSPVAQKLFKYVEFDEDEEVIAEIRKHPIGIIVIAIVGIFITLSLFLGSLLLAMNLESLGFDLGDGAGSFKAIIMGIGAILAVVALAVTGISIVLYRLNVVFVTNEKIAEVAYYSLFNRKVTQLGIGNIEDVSVHQRGIFAHIFNYGTLIVETASEKENATFTLVPTPNVFSQPIIEAHEKYVEKFGN